MAQQGVHVPPFDGVTGPENGTKSFFLHLKRPHEDVVEALSNVFGEAARLGAWFNPLGFQSVPERGAERERWR